MPKPAKKPRTKSPRIKAEALNNGMPADETAVATAVAEPLSEDLAPPVTPVEPEHVEPQVEPEPVEARARPETDDKQNKENKEPKGKDQVAASLNIAKLQAMFND